MAVDTLLLDVTRVAAQAAPGSLAEELTAIAIFDGEAWIALCQENGLVAQGPTAEEALADLLEAVHDASEFARERGLQVGARVADDEVRTFLMGHHEGRGSMTVFKFQIAQTA